jgi:hypothetical protein
MALATDVEVCGTDGIWRILAVTLAIPLKRKARMRCVECKGHVTLMDISKDGTNAAHVEHKDRWRGWPRSVEYDGAGLRGHPNQVPD